MRNKKKNRTYSVLIVSDATSTNKEFSISSKLIKNSIFAVSVLLLFFGFVIFDYLTISFDKEKMKQLQNKNETQAALITDLSSKMSSLNQSLQELNSFKKKILVATGLTSPYALKEVGRGGPATSAIINQQLSEVPATANSTIQNNNITAMADNYLKETKEIGKTFRNVEKVIDVQKIRLASIPSIWPTSGYISDSYGMRTHPITGKREFHPGLDIATQLGNPIIAPANGVVLQAEFQRYMGNMILIDHGFGYTTRYGHLANFNVKEGDPVTRGQVIGYVGNTGRSTAPHLHYEVRIHGVHKNPFNFIWD